MMACAVAGMWLHSTQHIETKSIATDNHTFVFSLSSGNIHYWVIAERVAYQRAATIDSQEVCLFLSESIVVILKHNDALTLPLPPLALVLVLGACSAYLLLWPQRKRPD
jgi:hypothetical protein